MKHIVFALLCIFTFTCHGADVGNLNVLGTLTLQNEPTADNHAATKLYVDSQPSGGASDELTSGSSTLKLADGALTLNLPSNTQAWHLLTNAWTIENMFVRIKNGDFGTYGDGDLDDRWNVDANGDQSWGPGLGNGPDTTLGRTGVGELTLTSSLALTSISLEVVKFSSTQSIKDDSGGLLATVDDTNGFRVKDEATGDITAKFALGDCAVNDQLVADSFRQGTPDNQANWSATDNLLAYYKMNENAASNTMADSSGNSLTGEYYGYNIGYGSASMKSSDATTADGKFSRGLKSYGYVADYMDDFYFTAVPHGNILNSIDTAGRFTIAFWIYWSGDAASAMLFHAYHGDLSENRIELYYSSDGLAATITSDGASAANYNYAVFDATLTEDAWSYITFSHDGSESNDKRIRITVNGALCPINLSTATPTWTFDPNAGFDTIAQSGYLLPCIGGMYDGSNYYSEDNFGRIDEWRLYGRVLGDAEISGLYNSGTGVETYPIVLGLDINESAYIAKDLMVDGGIYVLSDDRVKNKKGRPDFTKSDWKKVINALAIYDRIDQPEKRDQLGVIANELPAAFTKERKEKDGSKTLMVDWGRINSEMMLEIEIQNRRIDALEEAVKALL